DGNNNGSLYLGAQSLQRSLQKVTHARAFRHLGGQLFGNGRLETGSAYDPNRTSRGSALGASDSLIFSPSTPLLARKSISQIAGKDCGCLQGRPIVLVPASDFCLANGRFSLCVTGEDKVARFDLIVAGEAGFHERFVARFAVLEVSKTPTARCGVLFCVLDHKLNVRWGAGYERLGLAEDFVVFLRWHVTV